jgi:MFS family permease
VNTVLIVLTQMPLTHAVERFRRGRTAAAGMVFLGLGLGMLPFGRTMAFAAMALAVATIGEMLLMPTLVTLISLRAPEGGQGQYQGLFGLAWGIGSIIGPSLGTRIYETAGGTAVWLSAAALSALVAIGFMFLDRSDKRLASPPAGAAF